MPKRPSWRTPSPLTKRSESTTAATTRLTTAQHEAPSPPMEQAVAVDDIDAVLSMSSSGGNASWIQRVPWLRSRRDKQTTQTTDVYLASLKYQDGEAVYHGGAMEATSNEAAISSSSSSQAQQSCTKQPQQQATIENNTTTGSAEAPQSFSGDSKDGIQKGTRQRTSPFARIASFLTSTSLNTPMEDDSLGDFDESEWTPQDSSYGAAIPVGGWIPKAIRRTIEASLIAIVIFGLAYVVVTTSMRLEEQDDVSPSDQSSKSGGGDYHYDGGVGLDDDNYIEYKNRNDDELYADDDQVAGDDDAAAAYEANDDAYVDIDDQYDANGGYKNNGDDGF